VGTQTLLTIDEFLNIPDPKEGHFELHHGEIVFVPPPKWGRHEVQWKILALLQRSLGDRFVVRTEMAFRPEPEHEMWIGDVACVAKERARTTPPDAYLTGAPELVVEVISPGNTAEEIEDKQRICLANGCREFWTVFPKARTVSIASGDKTTRVGFDGSIESALFGDRIAVAEIFLPPDSLDS
jgi:Uma2 family endonuclease